MTEFWQGFWQGYIVGAFVCTIIYGIFSWRAAKTYKKWLNDTFEKLKAEL